MDPRQLFVQQIQPALAKFRSEYAGRDVGLGRDIALGAELAVLLLNLPEYLFDEDCRPPTLESPRSARDYREKFAWTSCPNYEIACDFANAWKHRTISRQGKRISSISDVWEAYAYCRYRDDLGYYVRGHKVVLVKTADGKRHDLRRILISSTRFWAEELLRLSVIPSTSSEMFEFDEFTARDDPMANSPLRLHGHQGEPVRFDCIRLDYNKEQGWVKPLGKWGKVTFPMEFVVHPSPFGAK